MCVIVAKWFDGIGWAGAKNRDRNYTPILDFIISETNGIERMMMHDKITGYKEGINSHGVSILNTSLDVYDDESEVEAGETDSSPDGRHIATALLMDNAIDAVKILVKRKLGGCTIVFDRDNLFLIEASDNDGKSSYKYKVKKISKDETIARTNHGLWLPWAGYQHKKSNKGESLSRLSSESRLLQAEEVVRLAKTPQDLVDGMCKINVNNPQLNILRTSTERKKMRTTSQQLCVPSERTLYCRPVSSHLQFDFWKLNRPKRNTWVELLSNRALWQDTKGDPPFDDMNMRDVK